MAALHPLVDACKDVDALKALIARAQSQIREIGREQKLKQEGTAWDAVKKARRGDILLSKREVGQHVYVINETEKGQARERHRKFIVGSMYTVYVIQPRKRLLWVKTSTGDLMCLNPQQLHRIAAEIHPDKMQALMALQSEQPQDPLHESNA